jgi:pimeloyl-ACP methyl ester carboxylesterase
MEKVFVKNRSGNNIAVNLEKNNKQTGLVFIMPGLGNKKEETNIQTFMDSFVDKGFTAITFDVTNGIGESDGDYSQASFTGYYNDLSDVIDWAKSQDFYQEPFVLVGHSMGGGCVLRYGADYPERLLGIAPVSTVIGGHQTIAKFTRDTLAVIKTEKGKEIIKKINWIPFVKDILKYDIVPEAYKFSMPILMMVGDQDMGTPLEDQMKLYQGMPNDKEIHVIKGAPHTFVEVEHLDQAKQIIHNWIDNRILK